MEPAPLNIADALTGVARLCIVTAPFIYLIERHPRYIQVMRRIFTQIDQGTLLGISSVISLTEVLSQPIKMGNAALEQAYRAILLTSRHFTLLPIDARAAERAAVLRATYNLRTPDALQLATAVESGCQAFLTNDRTLGRVTEVRVLVIDDLAP